MPEIPHIVVVPIFLNWRLR